MSDLRRQANSTIEGLLNPTQNLAQNGYIQLPGGLILQWGRLTSVSLNQTFHPVVFPIPFVSAALNINASIAMPAFISDNVAIVIKSDNITTTGFSVGADHGTTTSTGDIYWFAVGY